MLEIKINKIGISLVVAMFFIVLLIAFEFNFGIVSAVTRVVGNAPAYQSYSPTYEQFYSERGIVRRINGDQDIEKVYKDIVNALHLN